MRTYGQYCAVAKSLDVLGDRWTLLIIRELLLTHAARYTDLRNGLPGIATNLLAERLRELERAGLVAREEAAPPIATTLFSLTDRGRELEPVLHALGRWGLPYMAGGPAPGDAFRGHWLSWPAQEFLHDQAPDGPPVAIAVDVDGEEFVIECSAGAITVRDGRAERPDARLAGSPHAVLAVLTGGAQLDDASSALGLRFEGDREALLRLVPSPRLASVRP